MQQQIVVNSKIHFHLIFINLNNPRFLKYFCLQCITLLALVGLAASKPQTYSGYNREDERYSRILRYDNINHGDGTYNFNYETSNGIAHEENGYLKGRGTNNEIQTVQGSYQYYSPEGQLIQGK